MGVQNLSQLSLSGLKSAFKAKPNAQQNITQSTNIKVLFQTEVFDNLNEFNPSTGTFTASKKGYYRITACLGWQSSNNGNVHTMSAYINGVQNVMSKTQASIANALMVTSTYITALNAGDTVDIYAYHNNISSLNLQNTETWFSVEEI